MECFLCTCPRQASHVPFITLSTSLSYPGLPTTSFTHAIVNSTKCPQLLWRLEAVTNHATLTTFSLHPPHPHYQDHIPITFFTSPPQPPQPPAPHAPAHHLHHNQTILTTCPPHPPQTAIATFPPHLHNPNYNPTTPTGATPLTTPLPHKCTSHPLLRRCRRHTHLITPPPSQTHEYPSFLACFSSRITIYGNTIHTRIFLHE